MTIENGRKCATCGKTLSPIEAEEGNECAWCKHKRMLAELSRRRSVAEHSFFAAPTTKRRKHDAAAFIR